MPTRIPQNIRNRINGLVDLYVEHERFIVSFRDMIYNLVTNDPRLKPLVHSTKHRIKDPAHLKDKLIRKYRNSIEEGKRFNINRDNFFSKIEDLAGVRILHLNTQQFTEIDRILKLILQEQQIKLVGKPVANTWDDEYRKFFKDLSLKISSRDTLYTSVHYIVKANDTTQTRCEIQVRTLFEEVWGEVSHTINYPHESKSIACQEQLKVLARVTSSGTRLVDSIFKSLDEHKTME
jgi:putative GTP pyrophosphokinase